MNYTAYRLKSNSKTRPKENLRIPFFILHGNKMFNTKTVLVLGAGASYHYGFPTATGLKDIILGRQALRQSPMDTEWTLSAPRRHEIERLNRQKLLERASTYFVGNKLSALDRLIEGFNNSDLNSIDTFIHYNSTYKDAAKYLIARILLQKEKDSLLAGGWYQQLLHELLQPGSKLVQGMLSIISFNYERSLEKYLSETLKASLLTSVNGENRAAELFESIDFRHVYGSLGDCPFFDTSSNNIVEYGDIEAEVRASESVELMRLGGSHHATVQHLIFAAERIVFLGFGFDDLNMSALGFNEEGALNKKWKDKTFLASSYRLSKARQNAANARIPQIEWGDFNHTIDDFLMHHAVFN